MTYVFGNTEKTSIGQINPDGTTTWIGGNDSPLYQAYLAWVDEGNTPDPAPVPPAPVEPTAEEKLKASGLTVDELKSLLGLQ